MTIISHSHERERESVVVIMYCDHILVGNFSGHEYFSNFPFMFMAGLESLLCTLGQKGKLEEKKNSGLVL